MLLHQNASEFIWATYKFSIFYKEGTEEKMKINSKGEKSAITKKLMRFLEGFTGLLNLE